MDSETTMSREEKEALLNVRLEQIRKKNAELQKRYEEVQADKKNAEAVTSSSQGSRRVVSVPREVQQQSIIKPAKRDKAHHSKQSDKMQVQQNERGRTYQRFKNDDGPPPDPSYRFLADKSREISDNSKEEQQQPNRHQGSRRHPGNYGGQDFENVKSSIQKRRSYDTAVPRQPPKNKMEMCLRMTGRERREYENWKQERNQIEEDRLNRQKTSTGEWKREWDKDKDYKKDTTEVADATSTKGSWGKAAWGGQHYPGGSGLEAAVQRPGGRWTRHEKGGGRGANEDNLRNSGGPARMIQMDQDTINVSILNDVASTRRHSVSKDDDSLRKRSSDGDVENRNWRDGMKQRPSHDDKEENVTWNRNKMSQGGEVASTKSAQVPGLVARRQGTSDQEGGATSDVWEDDGSWEDCTSGNESHTMSEDGQGEVPIDRQETGSEDVGKEVPDEEGTREATPVAEDWATFTDPDPVGANEEDTGSKDRRIEEIRPAAETIDDRDRASAMDSPEDVEERTLHDSPAEVSDGHCSVVEEASVISEEKSQVE